MIENLNLKLSGREPVTRVELFELVNSWGRKDSFNFNDNLNIKKCEPNEKYPLDNLDVSKITNFMDLFRNSMYNGDLSKWDIKLGIFFNSCFENSDFNNNSISNWDTSSMFNTKNMFYNTVFNEDLSKWNTKEIRIMNNMFSNGCFNGDISNWNLNNVLDCDYIFLKNDSFNQKYFNITEKENNVYIIPLKTKNFLNWFENNREKIKELNTSKEEVLGFFSFDNNKNLEII